MKIVFPVLSLETGGGARYIYQVANGLVERGHEVVVIMPEAGLLAWPLKARLVRVQSLTATTIPEADFIVPNFWPTVMPAWESQKGRVVRLSLGYEPLWVPTPEKAKETYLIGAPVISISNWHRQLLLQQINLDSEVVYGGVDTKIFVPGPKASARSRRKRVFYIFRLKQYGYFWKGTDEFIAACRIVKQQIPNLEIHVVTPEGNSDGCPGFFTMNGTPDDKLLAQMYAAADLYVFNSSFEAFGLPPLEAMACGTAVVTSDCGGVRDFAYNRDNCLVVPVQDTRKLAKAMLTLLQDDSLRSRLAQRGHEFTKTWTWEQTTEKIEKFFTSS